MDKAEFLNYYLSPTEPKIRLGCVAVEEYNRQELAFEQRTYTSWADIAPWYLPWFFVGNKMVPCELIDVEPVTLEQFAQRFSDLELMTEGAGVDRRAKLTELKAKLLADPTARQLVDVALGRQTKNGVTMALDASHRLAALALVLHEQPDTRFSVRADVVSSPELERVFYCDLGAIVRWLG